MPDNKDSFEFEIVYGNTPRKRTNSFHEAMEYLRTFHGSDIVCDGDPSDVYSSVLVWANAEARDTGEYIIAEVLPQRRI